MMNPIEVYPDKDRLAQSATLRILQIGRDAIVQQGFFSLVLSGGSTPRPVYELLGKEKDSLDWAKVHIFWGDERCLPPDDTESNFQMVRETMLDKLLIPSANIHRIHGEDNPAEAAEQYEMELRALFSGSGGLGKFEAHPDFPVFDLILLGMGDDGHTASLFPGSPAVKETQRWVIAANHEQPPLPLVPRVTMTLPVINAAKHVIFLVSGRNKAERLREVISDEKLSTLPAGQVRPKSGNLVWLVDEAAAVKISGKG